MSERLTGSQAEQCCRSLDRPEPDYRLLYETMLQGVVYQDAQGRVVSMNPAAERILGRSREEFIGSTSVDLQHHTIREDGSPFPGVEHPSMVALRTGRQIQAQVMGVYNPHDRAYRWLNVSAVPVFRQGQGRPDAVYTLFDDITERKQAELALEASERRFQTLAAATFEGIALSEEGRLVDVNDQLARMLGYSWAEMIGMEVASLVPPEDRQRVLVPIEQAQEFVNEHQLIRKDGSRIVVESHGSTIQHEGRSLRITALRDITQRKQGEEELAAAKNRAEQAGHAKDHFLAVLSHELRTPLTPVVATLAMLQETPRLDADTREKLEMIRRNVELEARLIDDLLDLTRIARGKIELSLETVDLRTVLQRAIEVCLPNIEARRLHFSQALAPQPLYVRADASRLQQVFWNLLSNAAKFTPPDSCVGVSCSGQEGGAIVQITDSGVGIEAAALPRIFDAFEQADRSVTRQFGGLGLGLAICKALVTLHGGVITAHSEGRGHGATFRVVLPLVEAPIAAATPVSGVAGAAAAERALRILLVEDHGDTARIMRQILQVRGHQVQAAGDVASALELAASQPFDLVVSDLGLPDGNGLDLMRQLKQRHGLRGIALSGFGMEEDLRRSDEAGFLAHLTKPIDPRKLDEVIQSVMRHAS